MRGQLLLKRRTDSRSLPALVDMRVSPFKPCLPSRRMISSVEKEKESLRRPEPFLHGKILRNVHSPGSFSAMNNPLLESSCATTGRSLSVTSRPRFPPAQAASMPVLPTWRKRENTVTEPLLVHGDDLRHGGPPTSHEGVTT
ncbi:hypothetical protein EYF80_049965 [Liparis tanakae]|uniref:Uncharacterized protein n=1 Tax=Liparis tanakae TaxID=230148 RepID=A0A4Z2FFY3_9TELE|nr:hypothetical protein EYF80_049965 [Liparis tanakae]